MTQSRHPISSAPKDTVEHLELAGVKVGVGRTIWLYDAPRARRGRWREAYRRFSAILDEHISYEAQWVTEDGAALGFEPTEWTEDR